jgi:dUTP pyrophosphatase
MIQFKKEQPTAIIPQRHSEGAAGFDIYADIPEPLAVSGGDYAVINTNIALAIPDGYVGLIKPRSGWAVKNGIDTMAGVIDSDFRAAIKVIITKHDAGTFWVNPGDRIAQLVVVPVMLQSVEVQTLGDTVRGSNGFGSTGA